MYARRWAYRRNPAYYNFDEIGGDCTNFVSQCVYAGAGVMNYTRDFGWYYISSYDRSPSWTSVKYFYNFMTENEGVGPFGREADLTEAEIGDVIQLSYNDNPGFTHSLLIVSAGNFPDPDNILLSAHTMDTFRRRLSSYDYTNLRLIHIEGVRADG